MFHSSLGKQRSSEMLGGQIGQGRWVRHSLIVVCKRRQRTVYVTMILRGMDTTPLSFLLAVL